MSIRPCGFGGVELDFERERMNIDDAWIVGNDFEVCRILDDSLQTFNERVMRIEPEGTMTVFDGSAEECFLIGTTDDGKIGCFECS